jgi:hypothetical protein
VSVADPAPWPFGAARAAQHHHRVVHIFSARWSRWFADDDGRSHEVPALWAEAEDLRAIAAVHPGRSLASAFIGCGHLERQYDRVAARLPAIIGTPLRVDVPHRFACGHRDVPGDLLLVRLAGGQLSVCLSLEFDEPLSELPAALVFALEQGPGLALRVQAADASAAATNTILQTAVHHAVCCVEPLAQATAGTDRPRLLLASELHTMLFVREDDRSIHDDEALLQRLLGRVPSDVTTVGDSAILWPNEFNRWEDTIGAVRPGASLLGGQREPICRNAFVSALLLMGSASLLREARDEAYDVLDTVNDALKKPRHRWSIRGTDPFETEQARLAVLTIAVAFQVETHLDIRRVVSDAYLVDFHQCLATALAVPRSVETTTGATTRLEAAIRAAGVRSTTRNAFILTFVAGTVIGIASLLVALVH